MKEQRTADAKKLSEVKKSNLHTDINEKLKNNTESYLYKKDSFKESEKTIKIKVRMDKPSLESLHECIRPTVKIMHSKCKEKSKEYRQTVLDQLLSEISTVNYGKTWLQQNKDGIEFKYEHKSCKEGFNFKIYPESEEQELNELILTSYKNLQEAWINTEYSNMLNQLNTEYADECIVEKSRLDNTIHRPIVWGMTNDLVFSGKTVKKTVLIPFTKIHCKLAESNSIMIKQIESNLKANHLVAHIVFIVTDQPYVKAEVNGQQKYTGGRMFIDFPIIGDYTILPGLQVGDTYNSIVRQDYSIGQYYYGDTNKHSEKSLIDLLENKEKNNNKYIENMVSCLKAKIMKLPSYDYSFVQIFKIYAVNLFINSELNICNNCEEELYQLMNRKEQGSFLYLLKNELCSENNIMFTVGKNGFPYMFISISACRLYESSKRTLKEDAEQALNNGSAPIKKELSLDIKDLASEVILSTAEWWLYKTKQGYKSHIQQVINNPKIPFYAGFKSGNKVECSKTIYQLDYDTPYCFDDINMLGVIEQAEH